MLRKLPVTFARLLVSPPPPLASSASRHFSGSSSSSTKAAPGLTGGMKEFFASPTGDKQVVGRSWHASELRVKSFNDLHCLWFVCLKERNYLLSERLYYRQMQQSAPEGGRLHKVKKTMAAIKVVIGERARAAKAMEADLERAKVGAALEGALSGRGEDRVGGGAAAVDTPVETLEEEKNRAALERRKQLMDVPVTYKKFGRKYTVPASMAPEKPTRAELKRKAKTRIFFAKAAGLAAKPPTTVKTRQYE